MHAFWKGWRNYHEGIGKIRKRVFVVQATVDPGKFSGFF
ncbi:hypothetical protein B932_2310 [Gluconobacter oxydans H24]|nr:hypothetical protein B932_2310 [Gluconobacter oxydans H24]